MSLSIIYRSVADLKTAPRNPRTHSREQIRKLAKSIETFGFNNPILLGADDQIIAGHGRAQAAAELKMSTVPTVRLDHLSAEQRRAYVIADNRLAELAGWDDQLLALELGELSLLDLDFDLSNIGFEAAEIDLRIQPSIAERSPAPDPDDAIPALSHNFVTRRGDLWALGQHLLFCGDALDRASYDILLGAERAAAIFTDPPYNVPIAGHVSGLGKAAHSEFQMASGEMTPSQFTDFLRQIFEHMASVSVDGALHYVCMDWRHLPELLSAGNATFSELKNMCVWVKANGGMGSLYRSQHELVSVWKHGKGRHQNNVMLGRHGRNRTNVWSYPGMTSFQDGRDEALASHPTVKPVALVSDAILDCTERRDIVLDPFCGSGSTVLAAERTGRRSRAIELEPGYVDVSLRRFHQATGIDPVNLWTGQHFTDLDREEAQHG